MLEVLTVRNYALIEELQVAFGPRLNVLSGETGAGKSIIVGALGLLFGARSGAGDIRAGAGEAEVSAVFDLGGSSEQLYAQVEAWLAERELGSEDASLILRRVVKRNGRSACAIQGTPVPGAQLAELANLLFDIHGQHAHQSLLREDQHRRLLDRFGGLEGEAAEFGALHGELVRIREQLTSLSADAAERQRQSELLEHAIGEITDAQLSVEEEQELEQERKRLLNHERLYEVTREVYDRTAEAKGGALATLRAVLDDLRRLASLDDAFSGPSAQVESAFYEIEDVAESVRRYQDGLRFDADRLGAVADRLELVRDLQRKYGATVEAVIAYARDAEEQLAALQGSVEERGRIETRAGELELDLKRRAQQLTDRRTAVAERLQQQIEDELRELGMRKVRFAVQIRPRERNGKPTLASTGADQVELQIAPNVGEPLKPLRSIASGGELSRVMLALESTFADTDQVGTLVFDEVDAGIGGAVALAVGDKLHRIAQGRQILCITHLATIAARADHHLLVHKSERGGRTVTSVTRVSGDQRVSELARMLAGDKSADVSLQHAAQLLERYAVSEVPAGEGDRA